MGHSVSIDTELLGGVAFIQLLVNFIHGRCCAMNAVGVALVNFISIAIIVGVAQ